ncbi:MAG: adenylate/guanylate cyclase domain-containing protein [Candidatus Uhrbacteria bacterium]|nr:adenylate/guanylate cyclase domain-containing protein [Candidatus Uhrbacteria bacterium]
MHTLKHFGRQLLFAFCILLLAEMPFAFGLFHTVQEKITDRLFLNKPQSHDVVVVAIDDRSISDIGQWPWSRVVFAQALDQLTKDETQKPKAIGVDVSFSEASSIGSVDDEALTRTVSVVLPIDLGSNNQLMSHPLASFTASTKQGFIDSPIDGDGVVRRAETSRGTFESFAQALVPSNTYPKSYRIDYRGLDGFTTVSFSDVLHGLIPSRIFKDKIVLIGATAPNLHDIVSTPFNQMPGVVLNANEAQTLIDGTFFHDVDRNISYGLIALIFLCVSFAVANLKRLRTLTIVLVSIFVLILIDASVAFGFHIITPIFYELLAFVFALLASLAYEYISTAKEKAFIKNSFQYYLTPHVIEQILKDPEKLKLGGEKRNMTILFSDIRGFTTISEALTPEELTQLLNDYLSAMTDIIMEENGVVDKYIGDAIMAFWGAPLDNAVHASDACQSAVLMMRRLREFNLHSKTPLNIGIGLNTGDVVVGNMGSRKRFNYTVMGDEVNLASRLESLTKYYRVSVLVTEQTRDACSDETLRFRELDFVIVKGKKEPKKIFELIVDEPSDALDQALEAFQSGRLAYTNGNWDTAIVQFKKAIALNSDGPSQLFVERCEKLREHPPTDWNGVYAFESK